MKGDIECGRFDRVLDIFPKLNDNNSRMAAMRLASLIVNCKDPVISIFRDNLPFCETIAGDPTGGDIVRTAIAAAIIETSKHGRNYAYLAAEVISATIGAVPDMVSTIEFASTRIYGGYLFKKGSLRSPVDADAVLKLYKTLPATSDSALVAVAMVAATSKDDIIWRAAVYAASRLGLEIVPTPV
jgi:hypothetical protein